MESLIKQWDGENIIIRFDQSTGAWIFMAIHSTTLGPPVSGGTRMKSYPNVEAALQDALKLSAAMTSKLALAGIAHGGGKVVIALPPDFDPALRPELLRDYGTLLQQLGGLFLTGPDVGTSPEDMNIIAETGDPYVFSRTPEAGGAGDSGPGTAIGVLAAIRVTCEQLFDSDSLAGKRILIQGTGHVGRALIEMLQEAQAETLFSEVDKAAVQHFRDEVGLQFVSAAQAYSTPCDIFSPCALGGILNQDTISRLQCRAVVGSANNQLAGPADAEKLRERDILYAPDIAINVGGLMSIIGMETEGWSRAEAFKRVDHIVDRTLRQVYRLAAAEGLDTHTAALRIAQNRLAGAKPQTGDRSLFSDYFDNVTLT
jgi:leucine dehydrogenase